MPGIEPESGPVTIVSTRTLDRVPLPEGHHAEIPGGPAHYIAAAFDRLGRPYELITGEMARVEVILAPEGEMYVIPALPPIPMPSQLTGRAAILSPIMREIDLCSLPPADGLLVVDLQGFVREPFKPTGAPGEPVDLTALIRRAAIVKGSAGEVSRLTEASLGALADTVLVTTHGERGATVTCRGEEVFIPAEVVAAPHTIGAGDMYLAAFVDSMLRDQDPFRAGANAARFVEMILQERVHEQS